MGAHRLLRNIAFLTIFASLPFAFWETQSFCADYQQVAGLIDLRTTFSDGAYDLESLVRLAKKKGFCVLFINDHDRMAMEYGLFPFRNILKKRVELNSINKGGAKNYLNTIKEIEKKYPDMILIPGSETAPYYYWTGSYFSKNLTAHNHERRILTIGLEKAEDYRDFPIIHNGFSTRFTATFLPIVFIFFIPLILGIFLIRWKGIYRIFGIAIGVLSVLFIINANPFRSSPFDQYHGGQGIAPHQILIDYVNSRGGMTFWNYPETKSGKRKLGPIFVNTLPYPEVLEESKGYTGFAALYGDNITVTEPGNIWDKVLIEYCNGKRDRPAWGISTADFHKEGDSGEKLGNFPTVFFVHKKNKKEILEALKNGKMYACRGNYPQVTKLDEFSVYSTQGEIKGISGDEVMLKGNPRIKISLSASKPTKNRVKVRLIRSGEVIKSFKGELPMEIDFEDTYFRPGKKIYYRMDLRGYGILVSNPIFIIYK
jgi:hypothetical protein